MYQFGFEVLITVLVPGLLLTGAAVLAADVWAEGDFDTLIAPLEGSAFAEGVALLVVAATLGSALATMMWVLELKVIDPMTAEKLKVCDDQFDREWSRYVDSLTKEHNSHISRMVQAFYFELRAGAAGLVTSVVLVLATDVATWIPLTLAALCAVMVNDSFRLHYHLARFRHRHHSIPSIHAGTRTACIREECVKVTALSPEGIYLPAGNVQPNADLDTEPQV